MHAELLRKEDKLAIVKTRFQRGIGTSPLTSEGHSYGGEAAVRGTTKYGFGQEF